MEIAQAFVAIRPSTNPAQFKSQVQRDIEAPLREAGKRGGAAAGKEINDQLSKSAKSAALTLGATFGAVRLGQGLKEAVDNARDLNEAVNVTGLVFGNLRNQIDKIAEGSAKRFGLSERAFRQQAADVGSAFQNLGFSAAEAVKETEKLIERGVDLGSAFNVDPVEAVHNALRGLQGETEPLRTLNVFLSDQEVRLEAVRLGLAKTTASADRHARAQAALSLIYKQSDRVQGDFLNTAGDLANQERIQAALRENEAAQFGQKILPAYQAAIETVGKLTQAFGDLPSPIQLASVALLGLGLAARPIREVVTVVTSLRTAIIAKTAAQVADNAVSGQSIILANAQGKAVGTYAVQANTATAATSRWSGVMGTLAVSAGAAAAAVGGLVVLNKVFGSDPSAGNANEWAAALKELGESGEATGAVAKALGDDFGKLGSDLRKIDDDSTLGKTVKAMQHFSDFVNDHPLIPDGAGSGTVDFEEDIKALDKALADMVASGNAEQAAAAFAFLKAKAVEQGTSVDTVNNVFNDYIAAAAAAAGVTDELGDALGDTAHKASQAEAALLRIADRLFGSRSEQREAADALNSVTDAQAELAEAQADFAGTGEKATAAAERQRDAQKALTKAHESAADAVERLNEVKRDLADLDNAENRRLSELERAQITEREVTTDEEARQKEIDLTKFDRAATDKRADAEKAVADATDGVADANEGVRDAVKSVQEASAERAAVHAEAAARIVEAEGGVEDAVVKVVDAFGQVVEKEGLASSGAQALLDTLTAITKLPGLNPQLVADLQTVLRGDLFGGTSSSLGSSPATAKRNPLLILSDLFGLPFGGSFADGGVVPGPQGAPRAVIAHGGETIGAGSAISLHQENHFHGADVPTRAELEALNRKQAMQLHQLGRSG